MQSGAVLRIATDARLYIEGLISKGNYVNPVVSLIDEGPDMEVTGEAARVVRSAVLGSELDQSRARDLVSRTLSPRAIEWRLEVRINEREECAGVELVTLSGLTFAMPRHLRVALQDYCLVWRDKRLLLIGPGDEANSLSSVKTISLWK